MFSILNQHKGNTFIFNFEGQKTIIIWNEEQFPHKNKPHFRMLTNTWNNNQYFKKE